MDDTGAFERVFLKERVANGQGFLVVRDTLFDMFH